MSQRDDKVPSIRDTLAYVCAHADEIRTVPGAAALLDEVRAGADVAHKLDRLHTTLQRAGDALGVHGATERGLHPTGVPRRSIPAADEVVYLCPADVCSRYWLPQGDSDPPRCGLHGSALRRDRL
ncbi:hypothetical protein AB0883_02590 [Micromonospora sp. NPDC047812]|uniref:hypothetical protein n=1 Tax=Micromonospora sp. NPDC047812 TaxID=3155742 RepID=UPI00345705FF